MTFTKQPNVFFIVLDTHRRDRLGMYGYPKSTSPNLDTFAETACVFENAISPAQWTIPSHASMFSGENASTHLTTQAHHSLDHNFPTIAEVLKLQGYKNVGFCNNPLVGVLDNGLKRGFDIFYNYGGAVPSTPAHAETGLFSSFKRIWTWYTQLLRKISYPVQNAIARSERLLQFTLNPRIVPLWTKFANFKGDTQQSISDTIDFLHGNFEETEISPHFVFINLMETHLPFTPPNKFINKFADYYWENRQASEFMQFYNTQALRWLLPMEEPFSQIQYRTLSDFYDAEVAYQDYLLGALFEELDQPYHRENSLVMIVADHGEMLSEHDYMGHGFRIYQELVHVPLVLRFPGQENGRRITGLTSTKQLFHTVLDVTGINESILDQFKSDGKLLGEIKRLSLRNQFVGETSGFNNVLTEAYPPLNVIHIMENLVPELIDVNNSRSIYRGIIDELGYKLERIEDIGEKLYNLNVDPHEITPLIGESHEARQLELSEQMDFLIEKAVLRRPENWSRSKVMLDDEILLQRMRDLGYIE